ncbi:MAG: hypothetical protein CR957_00290 [Gammaproteobacteria bacterium]|nr:MAG: hypothetical protein CR957_00290 [Gammaproteobacteria bacterium]
MKTRYSLLALSLVALLAGCAKNVTVTDSVSLYPANAAAQRWGIINFYSQYQSNALPQPLQIHLPNSQTLQGQMTFVETSGHTEQRDSFWDNVRLGIGIGGGGGHGSWGVGLSSPERQTYRSDNQTVSVNAYASQLSMNCQGTFNRRQKTGTIQCQLTNGMQYSGSIRRIISPAFQK